MDEGRAQFMQATAATPAQMADMDAFCTLLAEASGRMNLVGPSAMAEFWTRHALDSAQLRQLAPEALVWADLGAGAGLPGIVLAILLKATPGAHVHLVESLAKRCRFLQAVVDALALSATVHAKRAESFDPAPTCDIVTARACAPLPRLLDYAFPFMRSGAPGLFLKGRGAEAEVAQARHAWRFTAVLTPSLSDPDGRIVSVEGLARARSERRRA